MNLKRLWPAWLAVFVWIFLFEWVFHGMLLRGIYAATPDLWRSEAEMRGHFHWLVLGQAVLAFVLCALLAQSGVKGGATAGLIYGVLLGFLFAGPTLVMYAVAPYSTQLILLWLLGRIVELGLAGLLAGALYRTRRAPAGVSGGS